MNNDKIMMYASVIAAGMLGQPTTEEVEVIADQLRELISPSEYYAAANTLIIDPKFVVALRDVLGVNGQDKDSRRENRRASRKFLRECVRKLEASAINHIGIKTRFDPLALLSVPANVAEAERTISDFFDGICASGEHWAFGKIQKRNSEEVHGSIYPATEEELPCPVCASTEISHGGMLNKHPNGVFSAQSVCNCCGAHGPLAILDKDEIDYGDVKSIAAWNRWAKSSAEVPA